MKAGDLWMEFCGPDPVPGERDYDRLKYNAFCGLCGNHGVVDTRGKVRTPAGYSCGVRRYCICPNGRALKRANRGRQP